MDSPTFYAIIPANVRYCKTLKANAKLLYGEITALCNRDGFCWAENKYFADLYEVSEETISRWISDLKKHQFIDVNLENEGGFLRKISLKNHFKKTKKALDENVKTPLTKSSRPLDEIVKTPLTKSSIYNNTVNTTINREGNALDFFENNHPFEFESLMMKYHSKINDFEKAKESFNLTFDKENLDYNPKIINARAQLFFNRWIENQNKFNQNNFQSTDQLQKVYRKNTF